MAKYICEKCNKIFSTKSNLNKHLKRKTPCDLKIKLDCGMCGKIFTSTYHLDRHLNRKNPCISIGGDMSNNMSNNMNNNMNNNLNNKIKIIAAETKKELILMDAKKKKEKELLVLKIKIEQLKTHRKELNFKHNTINIDNSNNNTINIIINNFRENVDNTRAILGKLSLDDFRYLVDTNIGVKGTIENIFRHFYNNPNFPENKTITCPDISKKDFHVYLDDMWKRVQYDEIRRPIINQLIQTIDHVLMYFCSASDASSIDIERQLCMTHQNHYDHCGEYIKNPKNNKQIKQSLRSALVL